MSTLYALTHEYARLTQLAEAGDEEVDAAFEEALADFDFSEEQKINGYVQVLRTFEAREAAKRQEARRLTDAADRDEATVGRLKAKLLQHLHATNRKSLSTSLYTVRRQLNGQAKVTVPKDARELPTEFQREKVVVEADRPSILLAWEQGRELPPGVSVVRGEQLRIS